MVKEQAIRAVQNKLWRNNYSVRNVAAVATYQLFVEGKYKVDVVMAKMVANNKGVRFDIKPNDMTPLKGNVLAIVFETELSKENIYFTKITKGVMDRFKEAGIINKGGMSFTMKVFKDIFNDSPAAIFKR